MSFPFIHSGVTPPSRGGSLAACVSQPLKTVTLVKATIVAKVAGDTGNYASHRHLTGLVQGVQPVALPLPTAARWLTVSRELVPHDRPLAVRIYYVTTAALAPLAGLWLSSLFLLAFFHRGALAKLVADLRARIAAAKEPPAPEPPAAPAE